MRWADDQPQWPLHCHRRAHKSAPPLTTPPHLRHLYAASPPQAAPLGSAAANQAPPYRSASGRGPPRETARPSRADTIPAEGAPPSGSQQPRAEAGAGRRVSPPSRPGLTPLFPQPGPRPASAPPPPPSRSPHSLFHRSRPAAEERTGSGTTIGYGPHSRKPAPTRTSGCDWLARRLFSTSGPDWLSRTPLPRGSLTLLQASASHPFNPVSIRAGGGPERARVRRELPIGGRREGREVGSAAGRPAGKVQPMGAHPTSRAQERPSLAARVPAGRAQGYAPAAGRLGGAPTGKVGRMRRGRRGDSGQPLWRAPSLST
ncbi:atherin-like [Camelus dromedarius]|uniref:atherin-like n=1 Tax=Camelus dromedarius TaxID=9838 RepID=UPI00311A8DA8